MWQIYWKTSILLEPEKGGIVSPHVASNNNNDFDFAVLIAFKWILKTLETYSLIKSREITSSFSI